MQQLLEDTDLRELDIHLFHHELTEQAKLVAEGKLDLAAFVMQDDAEFLYTIIRQYNLDIVGAPGPPGLDRTLPMAQSRPYPGRPLRPGPPQSPPHGQAGRAPANASDRQPVRPARRPDRAPTSTAAELPNFVRDNPPSSTAPPTVLPLAREARQFFLAGEPELADRYFPWLVNIMSPAYWVYLVMAVTILFNMMRGYSKFRLWRIDAAREKIETALKQLVDPAFTHAQMRAMPGEQVMAAPERRAAAQTLVDQLQALRARCQRQTNSFVTPMGDEMYYRYQQALIDEAITTLAALLQRVAIRTREQAGCCRCPATHPHRHRLDQTLPLIATAALRAMGGSW